MFTWSRGAHAAAALGAVGVLVGLGGCAPKVKRDEFNTEVARIREEMQAGDQKLAGRLDSTQQAVADHERRLDALDQELQAFRSEYNVSIEKVKGMLKFNVPVHFEFASGELREADRPVLDRFASVVKEYYPGALVTVEGFTDPAGSAAYNQRLGQRRPTRSRPISPLRAGSPARPSGGELRRGPESAGRPRCHGGRQRVENAVASSDHAEIATDQVAMP
jgi:outer membrane protein OmpA-like peptidoglycan-associated protein